MTGGKRFSPVLFILIAILFITGCHNDELGLKQTELAENKEKVDYKIYDFKLEFFKMDQLSWEFQADTVTVPLEDEFNSAKNVTVTFFKNNQMSSRLSSDSGEYYPLSGNIIADGNVIVQSSKEDKLLTSKLWWMEGIEEFWTEREVELIRIEDNSRLRGIRMRADRSLNNVRIDKHLETIIKDVNPEEEKKEENEPE